ncbi:MAG: hypothetical protein DRP42_04450, partial [Tenericutes bacterium]
MNELEQRQQQCTLLKDKSLDELATMYTDVDVQSKLIMGAILLEGRERFPSNNEFGQWCSPIFGGQTQQTTNNLMHLARFFKNRSFEKVGLSVGYIISSPATEEYASYLYDDVVASYDKTGKYSTIKEVKENLDFRMKDSPAGRKKAEAKRQKENEQYQREEEIDACKQDANELFKYIHSLFAKKKLSIEDQATLRNLTTAENVWSRGYDELKAEIDGLFDGMKDTKWNNEKVDEEVDPDDVINPETGEAYWRSDADKAYSKARRERNNMFNEVFLASPGQVIANILKEFPDLKKKVFKVMSQHLHPDMKSGD